jgi:hypothetical protein
MFRMTQRLCQILSIVLLGVLCVACGGEAAIAPTPTVSTSAGALTSPPEPVFEAEAVGPLTKATPLQIVSVFAYEPGEQLVTPATEIASFVSEARMSQGYGKEALRPLLVTPTPTAIKATQLMVIAWGPRSEFSAERAKEVGHAAMREALRMGVNEMAYAPIARDQGVTSLSADAVAAAFVEGALAEFLSERSATPAKPLNLRHVTYEAGPTFVESVSRATSRGVEAAHADVAGAGN